MRKHLRFVHPVSVALICILALASIVLPAYAQDGTVPATPDGGGATHQIFIPVVNSWRLADIAVNLAAQQTGLPPELLEIVDSSEVVFPALATTAYEFVVSSSQADAVRITLDTAGAGVDRTALDTAEAAAYAALGDYETAIQEEDQAAQQREEPGDTRALGSSFIPYVNSEHEYRVNPTNAKCLSGGIISLRLQPQNNRRSTANLKVTMGKCDGSKFTKGGTWWVLVDGAKRFGPYTLSPGQYSYTKVISLIANSWYDTKKGYTYQISLTTTGDSSPKYSGRVSGAIWGRCWCTDYVYQKLGLSTQSGYGAAKNWGTLLERNGYRKLKTSGSNLETPRSGDVVVLQPSFGSVDATNGHIGIIDQFNSSTWKFSLRQGGSVSTDWREEGYCYNARIVAYETSIKNNGSAAVYRK